MGSFLDFFGTKALRRPRGREYTKTGVFGLNVAAFYVFATIVEPPFEAANILFQFFSVIFLGRLT